MPPQSGYRQYAQQDHVEYTENREQLQINLHLWIICPHTDAVERIGIEKSVSLIGEEHARQAAEQADADRYGERTDHHGEGKLYTADDSAAENAAEEPFQRLWRKGSCKRAKFSAQKVQEKDPEIAQDNDLHRLIKFAEIETQKGHRCG